MPEYGLTSPLMLRKDGASVGSAIKWTGEKWRASTGDPYYSELCNWSRTIGTNLTDTGGTMATPGPQTLTFSKGVPLGISGTNTTTYLYISGGVGTAERVLITGGTAVSGASSGTITFTTANAHSGSWTIQSASQGIQEALNLAVANQRGMVVLPNGGISIYAPVSFNHNSVGIVGQGRLNSYINVMSSGWDVFTAGSGNYASPTSSNFFRDFSMTFSGSQTTGWGIKLNAASASEIANVTIAGMPNGIQVYDSGEVLIHAAYITGMKESNTGIGIEVSESSAGRTNAVWIDKCSIVGEDPNGATPNYASLAGIKLTSCGGPYLTHNSVVNAGYGLLIDPSTSQQVIWVFSVGNTYDNNLRTGVQINPNDTGLARTLNFVQDWASSNVTTGFNILHTGASAKVRGVKLVACEAVNNTQYGYLVNNDTTGNTQGVSLIGCIASGNSSGSAGSYHGIGFGTNMKDFSVIGCWSGMYDNFSRPAPNDTLSYQGYGIVVSDGCDRYTIQGNQLSGNTTGPITVGTTNAGYVWSVEGNIPETANRYHLAADVASLQVGAKYNDSGTLKVKT